MICVRVRIGPTRECKSPTILFTDSVVFRSWKKSRTRIPACTISVSTATMINSSIVTCIHTLPSPQLQRNPQDAWAISRLRFAKKSFSSGIDRRGDRIPLAHRHIFAALNQFIGAFPQFTGLLLREFAPFVGALGQVIAGL